MKCPHRVVRRSKFMVISTFIESSFSESSLCVYCSFHCYYFLEVILQILTVFNCCECYFRSKTVSRGLHQSGEGHSLGS